MNPDPIAMREILGAAVRFIVGGLLIAAGLSKLVDQTAFSTVLRQFPISRSLIRQDSWARKATVGLASLEVVSGLLMVLGLFIAIVQVLVIALLVVFSLAVTSALLRKEDVSCGCFGSHSTKRVKWSTIVRNLALIGLTIASTLSVRLSVDGVLAAEIQPGQLGGMLLVGVEAVLLVLLLRTFGGLRSSPAYVRTVEPLSPEGLNEVWQGRRESTWWHRRNGR